MEGSGLTPEDSWLRYGRYPYLLAKVVLFVLVGAGLLVSLRSVESVLFAVFVSMLLAYLLDPSVDWFEARGLSRTTGILVFLLLGGAGFAVFLLFLYPTVAHILSRIGGGVPRIIDVVESSTLPWLRGLGLEIPETLDAVLAQYGDTVKTALPGIVRTVTSAISDLWHSTSILLSSLLNVVLIPVLTFYFLRDFDRMRLAAVDYLPEHNRDWLVTRIKAMDEVVGAWFRGQVEVACILAVLYAIGLGFTFGLSGAGLTSGLALGLLSGLLNIVPYLGFVIGIVLSLLLALLDWAGWWPVVGVLATFAIVQGLEGYVVTPRIVGEKVGLSPVVVIVSLLLGGELLGPLGVVLALPMAGSLRVLLPDLVTWYRSSDLYTGVLRRKDVDPLGPVPVPVVVVRGQEGGDGDAGRPEQPGVVGEAREPLPIELPREHGGGRVPDGDGAGSQPDLPRGPDQRKDVEGGEGSPEAGPEDPVG